MKLKHIHTEDLEEELFEMSNLRKNFTGLPVNIYVSSGGSVNKKHGPRIKVMTTTSDKMNPYQTVSVILKRDITENDVVGYQMLSPEIIKKIKEYINLNYDVLLDYWNDVISTVELVQQLKAIK